MKKALVLIGAVVIGLSSCKKDDDLVTVPPPSNPPENITTIRLTFTESGNPGNTFIDNYSDPDGPGGNAPTIDTVHLENGKTYNVTIEFLDESQNPVEDITAEIQAEADEHIICYTPHNSNVTVNRTDTDGTYEVGLASDWIAGAAGTGDMDIALKHQPDVKDGTCTPGETDAEVEFPVVIQ